jgi:hypothetical protein
MTEDKKMRHLTVLMEPEKIKRLHMVALKKDTKAAIIVRRLIDEYLAENE